MVSGPIPERNRSAGEVEYSELDDFDHGLLAAREAFPDWDIFHLAHGYAAVPAGCVLFMASDTDALVAKLRSQT